MQQAQMRAPASMPAAWAGVCGATCFTYVHVHVSGESQKWGQSVGQFVRASVGQFVRASVPSQCTCSRQLNARHLNEMSEAATCQE